MSFSKTPALVVLAASVLGFAWIANPSIGEAQAPSDARWTDAAAVPGVAGTGELLDTPPIPTPEQIRDRELGMNLANPEVDRNETLDPVAPPEVESTDIDSGPRGGQRPDVQVPDGDERTLSVRAGGQFLFWNLGPATTASDWFGDLTVAWLFNPDAGRWNPYIPALGRGDFPLVDGLVLWLVSPVDQVLTLLLPAVQAGLQTAAANDFVIFRNTEVLQGTNTSRIGEPDAGNDRNAILYTGNWHAAASFDNGSSWS